MHLSPHIAAISPSVDARLAAASASTAQLPTAFVQASWGTVFVANASPPAIGGLLPTFRAQPATSAQKASHASALAALAAWPQAPHGDLHLTPIPIVTREPSKPDVPVAPTEYNAVKEQGSDRAAAASPIPPRTLDAIFIAPGHTSSSWDGSAFGLHANTFGAPRAIAAHKESGHPSGSVKPANTASQGQQELHLSQPVSSLESSTACGAPAIIEHCVAVVEPVSARSVSPSPARSSSWEACSGFVSRPTATAGTSNHRLKDTATETGSNSGATASKDLPAQAAPFERANEHARSSGITVSPSVSDRSPMASAARAEPASTACMTGTATSGFFQAAQTPSHRTAGPMLDVAEAKGAAHNAPLASSKIDADFAASATRARLEVGVLDVTHGWVKVRADMTGSGQINASLSVGPLAHVTLHAALPEIAGYLEAEGIQLARLDVHSVSDAASAFAVMQQKQSGTDSSAGHQQEQGQQPSPDPAPEQAVDDESTGEDAARHAPCHLPWKQPLHAMGGWLSICA